MKQAKEGPFKPSSIWLVSDVGFWPPQSKRKLVCSPPASAGTSQSFPGQQCQ